MKTPLLTCLMVVLLACTAQAQSSFRPEASLGIKGGLNLSNYTFDPNITQQARTAYTGGLVFKHIAQRKLGIQLEANFVQRGWTETAASGGTFTRELDYLEVPFMTHVAIGQRTRFILNFGPNASFLLNSPAGAPIPEGQTEQGYYQKPIDNEFMIALSLGIGMSKITSFGEFQLEARLTQGLNDIFDIEQNVATSRNTNVGLTLAYLLNLRRN